MSLEERIERLRADPRFARLPYTEQTEVMGQVIGARAPIDLPSWNEASTEAKMQFMRQALNRAPALENKEMQEKIAQMGAQIQGGDEGAIRQASNFLIRRSVYSRSIVANLLDEHLWSPFIAKTMEGTEELRNESIINLPLEDELRVTDYFSSLINQDKQVSRRTKIIGTIAGLGAQFAEILLLYKVGVGFTPDKAAGLGKLFTWPFERVRQVMANTPATETLLTFGKGISHAAAGGIVGAMREFTLDALEGVQYDGNFQEMAANAKTYFGEYFLGDVLANIGGGIVLPMIRANARNFTKGFGQSDEILKHLQSGDLKTLVQSIAKMEDVPDVLIRQMLPETKANLRSIQNGIATFYKLGRINANELSEDLIKSIATANHFGVKATEAGFEVWNFFDPTQKATLSNLEELSSYLSETILKEKNRIAIELTDATVRGAGYDHLQLRKVIKQNLPLDQADNVDLLTTILAPQGGKFTSARLRDFSRGYIGSMNGDGALVRGLQVDEITKSGRTYLRLNSNGKELTTIRSGPLSAAEEYKSVQKITSALNTLADDIGLKGTKRLVTSEYVANLNKLSLYTPGWLDITARTNLDAHITRRGEAYLLAFNDPKVGTISFSNLEEIGDFILAKATTLDEATHYLATSEGLTLKQSDSGLKLFDSGKKEVWSGTTVEELLLTHPEFMPKAPAGLGPTVGVIVPPGGGKVQGQLRYVEKAVIGSFEDVSKHFAQFKNTSLPAEKVKLSPSGATASFTKKGRNEIWEVYYPEVEYRGQFSSLEEARDFIKDAPDSFRLMEDIAHEKGMQLDMFDGDFYLLNELGEVQRAQTVIELQKLLADVPTPAWAPELVANIQPAGAPQGNGWKPNPIEGRTLKTMRKQRQAFSELADFMKPTESVFEDAVRFGGGEEYLELFRQVEIGLRAVNGRQQTIGRAAHTIFSEGGKTFPEEIMQKIGLLLETDEAKWIETIAKLNLEDKHVTAAHSFRELLGTSSDTGLGRQFGVAPRKWLENYVPHIRKWLGENPTKNLDTMESTDILKEIYGGNVPEDLISFFKYTRKADQFMNLVRERNPLKLLLKYSATGNRELFLGEAFEKIKALSSNIKNVPQIDANQAIKLHLYMEDIMSVPTGSETIMRRLSHKLYAAFGLDKADAKSLHEYLMLMGYGATMAFRPWLPIRNTFQTWTTLAPIINNNYVKAGYKDVLNDVDGTMFDEMRRTGHLTTDQPIFGGDTLVDNQGFLAKLIRKGLKWYRGSDDLDRGVGYAGATRKFNDAVEKFKTRGLTPQEFSSEIGLTFFDPTLQNKVLNAIGTGDWEVGLDIYRRAVIDRAFFPYRPGMTPFRGVMGKVFGQFGFYPMYYVDNIRKTMLNATWPDKLAFAGTMTANSLLIYEGFKQLGVEAKNFQPWNPMFFAGGPLYQMMNNAMQAPSAIWGNYKGRQAAAELLGLSSKDGKIVFNPGKSELGKLLVPGSFQMKAMGKAYQALADGDIQGFFLHLTSAPTTENF